MNQSDARVLGKICSRYSSIAGVSADDFRKCMLQRTPFSFRANTLKASAGDVIGRLEKQGIGMTAVPWYSDAFTSDKPVGRTKEHEDGLIYVQGLSSMLPALAVREELESTGLVLDACAAPGSKTTQMAALMGGRGVIIANDASRGRLKALRSNLERCGVENTLITNYDLRGFPSGEVRVLPLAPGRETEMFILPKPKFDVVLLDAPCSGEGTFMDNPDGLRMWSEKRIRVLSRLQKQLIMKAYEVLENGGVMVYSTCTFAPEENEMIVGHLLEKTDAVLEEISLPKISLCDGITSWNKKNLNPGLAKCARVWPHQQVGMGGFFMAKVRKADDVL